MRLVCPMCKKVVEDAPSDFPARPFCSARCKFADLDSWLSESYRISSPLGVSDLGEREQEQQEPSSPQTAGSPRPKRR